MSATIMMATFLVVLGLYGVSVRLDEIRKELRAIRGAAPVKREGGAEC